MMGCPSDEVFAAWLDHALADHERASAIDHAAACDRCRELVGVIFEGKQLPLAIGRYEITGSIGGGGMGIVLRGRDPVLDRSVAIKLARTGTDGAMLGEAQALARLNHPNVVAVHDFGESGGEVFVAMALADGVPLSRWLAAPHSLAARLRVLDGVAAGLAAIHDAGLVHRDIKPDNIVVDAASTASIVDFGLARSSVPGAVGTGIAGTRAYIAPEVLAGAAASPASDQYAWWILVEEVLDKLPAMRRVKAAHARGTSSHRYDDMRQAAAALQRACAPRWRVPVAVGAALVIAAGIAWSGTRGGDDPCAWTATYDRGPVETGLRAAGVDAPRVLAAIERRATATATLRHESCTLARSGDAGERARGQYQLACLDRTWAEAASRFGGLAARDRDGVWATLDDLGLVLEPARCANTARAIAAPPAVDPNAEVTRLGLALMSVSRDRTIDTTTRLARIDAMGAPILATAYAPLAARWHAQRAGQLVQLGQFPASAAALDRSELAAEASGDDDLRAEIAIDRLAHAYSAGTRDTSALEARATALVDKLDNPVRRAELADTRGMLQASRGDVQGAIASMRSALALYDELSLDASARSTRALQNLGAVLQMSGDLDGAQQALDRGLALTVRRFGAESSEAFEMRGARATNLLAAGRTEEARRELGLVVEGLARHAGTGDSTLGMAHMMLCQAETEAKAATAVERCGAALAHAEATFGKTHAQLVAYLTLYGNALLAAARAQEAVDVLARAIELAQAGTITDVELPYAQGYFALALRATGRRDPRAPAAARAARAALGGRPDAKRFVDELAAAFGD